MSAILTIDKGNTATKVKVFSDSGRPLYAVTMAESDIDNIADIITQFSVTCGAICSVGRLDARLVESLRLLLPEGFMFFTCDSDVPIKVKYDTPRTLGADRVAAACGAVSLCPGVPLLIADAGTALTLDFTDADGSFLGGNISAGISLRLKALHQYTEALPEVSPVGSLPEFGHDTPSALRCGALRGVAAEIIAAYNVALSKNPAAKLILTGGDAPLLSQILPSDTICHPDLVSLGLISILKYNEYI